VVSSSLGKKSKSGGTKSVTGLKFETREYTLNGDNKTPHVFLSTKLKVLSAVDVSA
jgi:hypothetical protein